MKNAAALHSLRVGVDALCSYAFSKGSLAVVCVCASAACMAGPQGESVAPVTEQASRPFASAQATLVDFAWDGVVLAETAADAEEAIARQTTFTVGALNAHGSVGRLEQLVTSEVATADLPDGSVRVAYHATLPVAWNRDEAQPTTFGFILPRNGSPSGVDAFVSAYAATCAEGGGHDVDSGSMFYFYRPELATCRPLPADAALFRAAVTLSTANTVGKYPEYHRIWQDDLLKAVVIFGKYEEDATTNADPGIEGYEQFIDSARAKLRALGGAVITTPATLPKNPGIAVPDVTVSADLPYGKRAEIHVSLVSNVSKVDAAWDERYAALTPRADLILYNGHAGLGANVRALLGKGAWNAGQYLMFFMNGCDTFAYTDGRLRAARALLNPDDPSGSKYLDMVTNAMPSFANAYESETVLLASLLDWQTPTAYTVMFRKVDAYQVSVVTGEEDNEFVPGMQVGSQSAPPKKPDDGSPDAATKPQVQDAGIAADSGGTLRADAAALPAPSPATSGGVGAEPTGAGCACTQTRRAQPELPSPATAVLGLGTVACLLSRRRPRAQR
jgi:hypothetical protein